MKKKPLFIIFLLLLLLVIVSAALVTAAGDYTVSWWSIDGGGGGSSGDQYKLSGTIGQADSGLMSGGGYSVLGGYVSTDAEIDPAGNFVYLPVIRLK